MDLERNLIDNILECREKLGDTPFPVGFYYPKSSLLELLDCDEEGLAAAIADFIHRETGRLGDVMIKEADEGRFEVTVRTPGVKWVYENFTASAFMKEFVPEVKNPHNTIEDMIRLFRKYSKDAQIIKVGEHEWALSFPDDAIDPYVYHISQNAFGLEYHRFTKAAYAMLM